MHLFQQSGGQLARAGGAAGPRGEVLLRRGTPLQPDLRAVTCLAIAEQAAPSAVGTGEAQRHGGHLFRAAAKRSVGCAGCRLASQDDAVLRARSDRRVLLAAGKMGGIVAVWRGEALKQQAVPRDSLTGAASVIGQAHAEMSGSD